MSPNTLNPTALRYAIAYTSPQSAFTSFAKTQRTYLKFNSPQVLRYLLGGHDIKCVLLLFLHEKVGLCFGCLFALEFF